ncbi:hypothetical protein Tco_0044179, partial [Tanacetum coccineum]
MTKPTTFTTLRRALSIVVRVATVALWGCSIGPGSFLPPVLLLVIVVVSIAVVVVVIIVVMVIVVGVSLAVFPFPFIAFTNSSSPTLNCLLDQFMGHTFQETHAHTFQSSSFQWAPIQDTSKLVRGNDYLFCGHHSFHVAPGDLISISKSQSLNISVPP